MANRRLGHPEEAKKWLTKGAKANGSCGFGKSKGWASERWRTCPQPPS